MMLTAPFHLTKRFLPAMKKKGILGFAHSFRVSMIMFNYVQFLPAATKLGQGNIFTSVCQEFCSQGEGGCLPQCMLGYTPRADTPPDQTPPGADTPRTRHPPTPSKQTAAYGQRAAGTHPTGMHSCIFRFRFLLHWTSRSGWGRIVNMSSQMGFISTQGKAVYSAAKTGLIGFTKVSYQFS